MFSLFNLIMLVEYPEFLRPLFFDEPHVWLCLTAFTFFTVFGIFWEFPLGLYLARFLDFKTCGF